MKKAFQPHFSDFDRFRCQCQSTGWLIKNWNRISIKTVRTKIEKEFLTTFCICESRWTIRFIRWLCLKKKSYSSLITFFGFLRWKPYQNLVILLWCCRPSLSTALCLEKTLTDLEVKCRMLSTSLLLNLLNLSR